MKRVIATLLIFLILGSGMNLKASLHFCGDVITQIAMGDHSENDPCECADMGNTDCCSDVEIKTTNLETPTPTSCIQVTKPYSSILQVCLQENISIHSLQRPESYIERNRLCAVGRCLDHLSQLQVFRI